MRTHEKQARGCPAGALWGVVVAVLLGVPVWGQARTAVSRQGSTQASDDPYFIVVCTDVSGSMNVSDPPFVDTATRQQTTLRDDAQFTFLALLGESPTESLVGVCKFCDRISDGQPGGNAEIVPADNALLTWQQIGADWQNVRERISTRKSDSGGTRIETALQWARRRIGLARSNHQSRGHGIVILLSDGDPDRASNQVAGGPVLNAAAALAAEDIRVYAIIVNGASYRSGRETRKLSDRNMAAETLMDKIGAMTRGRTYRITATSSLLDIFLSIFQAVPSSPPISNVAAFDVSRHHRTVVFVGPSLESVTLEPLAGRAAGKPYSLAVKDGLDAASGIDRRIIPLAKWNIMIMRRPVESGRLDRYWCGKWRPGAGTPYDGRIYLITDFLLRLEMEPKSPCWIDEQVRIGARLVDRPRELGDDREIVAPVLGQDLSFSFVVTRGQTPAPVAISIDKWDAPQRIYHSAPFQLNAPGQYTITCNCVDRAGNREIPLGAFSTDLRVEPSPLSFAIRRASTGAVVFPRSPDSPQDADAIRKGEEVYAELRRQGSASVEIADARLDVANLTPSQRPFHSEAGRLVTDTFALPANDKRLAGHALVKVRMAGADRELRLPGDGFDFLYDNPSELTCQFSDQRAALWVGECHRQILQLSLSPVFADAAGAAGALFPRELPRASMTFLAGPEDPPIVLPVQCTLDKLTKEGQDKAFRITGTYTLELGGMIPPSRRCEIDLGAVVSGVQTPRRSYDVTDPVNQGVFAYRVMQEPDERTYKGVAETLVADEPIVFGATWADDQDVNSVTVEVRERGMSDVAKPIRVLLPQAGTATGSQATRLLQKELRKEKNYDVSVVIGCRPRGTNRYATIRLPAGAFKAVERRLTLSQLAIGSGGGEDLSCYTLETMEVPLRVRFTGYSPGNPDHNRQITDFKNSCRLVASRDDGSQTDLSAAMDWPTAREEADRTYVLEGRALYTPGRMGRHVMELTGDFEESGSEGKLRSVCTARCRLSAGTPRFAMRVLGTVPPEERMLFDSERAAVEVKPAEPARSSYVTRLRVLLDLAEAIRSSGGQPLKVNVAVKRKNPDEDYAEAVFSRDLEFTDANEKAEILVDRSSLEREGDYAVWLSTVGPGPGGASLSLKTPTLIVVGDRIVPEEVVAPRGFLTVATRQWPFSYRIPVQDSLPFRSADLRFEFRFAGENESWHEGVASVDEGSRCLRVQPSDFLPSLDGVTDGPMEFRLRCMGIDPVTWKSISPVQIVKPYLEGADLYFRKGAGERLLTGSNPRVKPPFELRVRPRFRAAAELQGWWAPRETKVYVVRTTGLIDGESLASPELLKKTIELANMDRKGDTARIWLVQDHSPGQADEPSMREPSSVRFWGWPRVRRDDTYQVLVQASYDERPFDAPVDGGKAQTPPREIREGLIASTITVDRPLLDVPILWWLALALAMAYVLVQITKRWVPAPDELGLNIYVKGHAAIAPAGLNSAEARLDRETSWADEKRMYGEYLSSRHPQWSPAVRQWATRLVVAFTRVFTARRRLWIRVHPIAGPAAKDVQTAVLCLWTGLSRRRGVLWSSTNGVIDLPGAGTDKKVDLNLAYRVDPDPNRTVPVPVVMCIKRA